MHRPPISSLGLDGVYPHMLPHTLLLVDQGARPIQHRLRGLSPPHAAWTNAAAVSTMSALSCMMTRGLQCGEEIDVDNSDHLSLGRDGYLFIYPRGMS